MGIATTACVELEGEIAQIEPLLALDALIRPKRPLPPMREYAIAPDFARILYELVRDVAPKQIVETGSGVSTLVCAYALEAIGGEGKVLALDHDAGSPLARHGLSHRATVVHAPLGETTANGTKCTWYATDALTSIASIDMVVDDGPPKYVGKMARLASLYVLSATRCR